ncbi:MAG: hypothetical protein GX970_02525 [Phyllobacteriaceae bacterium]|nr:hypothetical protein [Phyllobacteriaceae bacterium]
MLLAMTGVGLLAMMVQFPFSLNHDAAWHFYTALRFLLGDRIGLDIADINPPMALWLFSVPGIVAKSLGLDPAHVFRAFVFFVAALSLLLTRRALVELGVREERLLLVSLAAVFLLMPGYHFGQREHLAALLVLPYVSRACLQIDPRPFGRFEAGSVALLAAIGICFKPYFLAVPLLVEVWLAFRMRSFRSLVRLETLTMVTVGIAYLGAVLAFVPHYLWLVVPQAMATYAGFESGPWAVANEAAWALQLPLLALGIGVIACRRIEPLSAAFIVAGLGFLVAALLQQKGWPYQLLPAALFCVAAAVVQLANAPRWRIPMALAIGLAVLLPVLSNLRDNLDANGTTSRVSRLADVFSEPDIRSVYAFITSPRDMHPAVLSSGVRWADAHGVMIFLPGHIKALDAEDHNPRAAKAIALSDTYLEAMLARFAKSPPDLLAFDRLPFKLGIANSAQFDYVDFLQRYPTFVSLIGQYEERGSVGRFRLFQHLQGQWDHVLTEAQQ